MNSEIANVGSRLRSSEKRLLLSFGLGAWALFYLPGVLGSYGYFIDELYYRLRGAPGVGLRRPPAAVVLLLAMTRRDFRRLPSGLSALAGARGSGVGGAHGAAGAPRSARAPSARRSPPRPSWLAARSRRSCSACSR